LDGVEKLLESIIQQIVKDYREGQSTREIAKKYETYPNKVLSILRKCNEPVRNKSEAQKIALDLGKSKPPLLGKKRSETDKDNISRGRAKAWANISDEQRESFKDGARTRWEAMSEQDRVDMQSKAGEALRAASTQGSKAEKFLYEHLLKKGYNVQLHKKGLIVGEKYEIDLFLPELKTIIEIDGPQHFLPIFGEERLDKTVKFDIIKNGVLLSKGFCVVRVKYMTKHLSRKKTTDLLYLVCEELERIKKEFPKEGHRLIEVELS
jgi:hypothetical protein